MNVLIIKIKPEHERILSFIFPTYTICEATERPAYNFIIHRDVASKVEKDTLQFRHHDCIFISNKLFDEVWDEDVLINKVFEFSKVVLKNRRRTINIEKNDFFIDSLINYMFFPEDSQEHEDSILDLFNQFGSKNFNKQFLLLAQHIPVSVLIASMNTFITKIVQDDSNSIYYKKKSILYRDRIKANFIKALDAYNLRTRDNEGLSFIKYCSDLISND